MSDYLSLIVDAISAAFSWATSILDKSGLMGGYLGMMLITIVFYKLLRPLMRGSGSDRASKRNQKGDKLVNE